MSVSLSQLKDLAIKANFFTSDSRRAAPGGIFVALKGEKTDGHSFAKGLVNTQGLTLILGEDFLKANPDIRKAPNVIVVENTAHAHREHVAGGAQQARATHSHGLLQRRARH